MFGRKKRNDPAADVEVPVSASRGADYARETDPDSLGGDYARDTHRGGLADDYARDPVTATPPTADPLLPRSLDSPDADDRRTHSGPRGFRRSDDQIREAVSERLTMSHDVDARRIAVSVRDGAVVLTGNVDDQSQWLAASQAADGCGGVSAVENRVNVLDAPQERHLGKASE